MRAQKKARTAHVLFKRDTPFRPKVVKSKKVYSRKLNIVTLVDIDTRKVVNLASSEAFFVWRVNEILHVSHTAFWKHFGLRL